MLSKIPLISVVADNPDIRAGQTFNLIATIVVPSGYHLVRQADLLNLSLLDPPAGVQTGTILYPATTSFIAGFEVFSGTVVLTLPVTIQTAYATLDLQSVVSWQMCQDSGVCLRPASQVLPIALHVSPGDAPNQLLTFLLYFALAIMGGLILNVMPCVLPVLSLKVMAMVRPGRDPRARRQEGSAMITGIMVSLMVLAMVMVALQSAGMALGWGFQFQSTWYTLGLSLVVFMLALSLLDVWRIPQFRIRNKVQLQGTSDPSSLDWWKHFANGFLLVLLATPCTAPFLGTALGFALSAPPLILVLVFIGIGIGLSLPIALMLFLPGKAWRLPTPGPWMKRLQEVMGLSLLATLAWLLTVQVSQLNAGRFAASLAALLVIGLILRVGTWVQDAGWTGRKNRLALIGQVLAFLVAVWFLVIQPGLGSALPGNLSTENAVSTRQISPGWERFDETAVEAELQAGHGVFIDFTAAWCLTCKINEAGALSDEVLTKAFAVSGITRFRGDYTNPDPVITRWLTRYQRAGVPFYLLLRPGYPALVLPEILSAGMVLDAIQGGPHN